MVRLKDMNLALLSELSWFLATDENKFWIKALKTKYFASKSFLRCSRKKNCSWSWRGLLMSRKLLDNGLYYRIGKVDRINIWENPWVPNNPKFRPIPSSDDSMREYGMVNSLRLPDGSWNLEKINHLFDRESAKSISKIPISNVDLEDKLIWSGNSNREFSVKSAFLLEF